MRLGVGFESFDYNSITESQIVRNVLYLGFGSGMAQETSWRSFATKRPCVLVKFAIQQALGHFLRRSRAIVNTLKTPDSVVECSWKVAKCQTSLSVWKPKTVCCAALNVFQSASNMDRSHSCLSASGRNVAIRFVPLKSDNSAFFECVPVLTNTAGRSALRGTTFSAAGLLNTSSRHHQTFVLLIPFYYNNSKLI